MITLKCNRSGDSLPKKFSYFADLSEVLNHLIYMKDHTHIPPPATHNTFPMHSNMTIKTVSSLRPYSTCKLRRQPATVSRMLLEDTRCLNQRHRALLLTVVAVGRMSAFLCVASPRLCSHGDMKRDRGSLHTQRFTLQGRDRNQIFYNAW